MMRGFKRSRYEGGASILVLPKDGRALNRNNLYPELHVTGPNLQAASYVDWKAFQKSPSAAVELVLAEGRIG